MDTWEIVESRFTAEHARAWEGLFTLGSGYLHVRGSLEEHINNAPQNLTYTRLPVNVTSETFAEAKAKWGTYVPGVFGRHPLLNNEMINLPWFLGIVPIVDGERLDMEQCLVENYRRVLRLDTAVLNRSLNWRTRSGKLFHVEFQRFVDAVHPQITLQRLRLSSPDDADVRVESCIDADVRTNGFDHFTQVAFEKLGPNRMACRLQTDAGDRIDICSRMSGAEWRYEERGRRALLAREWAYQAKLGTLVIEKRTAITTSRDLHPEKPEQCLHAIEEWNYATVRARHSDAWRRRWETCDVVIQGDDESQLAMRVALYHLLRAHVSNDSRVAIDAKGYAGEAYWGRYFWDTEMFLLPFFLYTDPQRARTLVDFRVHSLPGARENARRYGYPGARYAWESDASGIECCPNWQYADHEVHVTADVVYGVAHYARATGDPTYLDGPAAQVLLETARYWMARIDQRPGEDRASLLGVMGPDEYTPLSSNNSFTNLMVAHALRCAADHGPAAGASAEECFGFRRMAERLLPVRRKDGLVMQCEEFEQWAELPFDQLRKDRARPLAAQISQERLYRSKALKQADVLMLMMLFPQDYDDATVRQAWDYYLPYTTHDSSLSAGVHAIVAARLGLREAAWRFWRRARAIDLDVEQGGAGEGIHIANAGAVWQMAVFGFGGMRTAMQSEKLTFKPRLPQEWSRLAFPIVWKGTPLAIEMTHYEVKIANRGEFSLAVVVNGDEKAVPAAAVQVWKYSP